jgi:hypothetical protein
MRIMYIQGQIAVRNSRSTSVSNPRVGYQAMDGRRGARLLVQRQAEEGVLAS